MRTGQGTYYFANGNKYVGEWHEDMRQGMGICFYPAMNCKYVGEWENDRRHGKVSGEITLPSGHWTLSNGGFHSCRLSGHL